MVHTRANVFELMRSWFHIALLRRDASLKDIFPLVSYIVDLVNQYKLEEDFDPICIYVFSNCIQNRKILVSDVYNTNVVYGLNTFQLIILFKFASNAILLI